MRYRATDDIWRDNKPSQRDACRFLRGSIACSHIREHCCFALSRIYSLTSARPVFIACQHAECDIVIPSIYLSVHHLVVLYLNECTCCQTFSWPSGRGFSLVFTILRAPLSLHYSGKCRTVGTYSPRRNHGRVTASRQTEKTVDTRHWRVDWLWIHSAKGDVTRSGTMEKKDIRVVICCCQPSSRKVD